MRLFPRNPGSLLLAIVLACLVWYINALDRRQRISERQLDAPVSLVNIPLDMMVTSEVPRSLTLRLRGPLSLLGSVEPSQIGVVIDLRGFSEGVHAVVVENANVVVPARIQVLAISPSQLPLRVERVMRRRVPIKPRLSGVPAAGSTVRQIVVEPGTAVVNGPRGPLETLPGVPTDPILVDGAEGPVEAVVAVRSPQPLMRIVEPLEVRVIVVIEPVSGPGMGGRKR
jgi:YbbR domain-containing protein